MASRAERSGSFGAIAEDYDRLRPRPADEAVDWLVPAGCQVAVDVAAGTGLLTRALAARVPEVIAVEPDDRMRAVLAERTPEVRALAGYGESIPLSDESADAVFVSSAWHWMDEPRAIPEIARVLRPGGRFGLIWTSRDREVEWVRELDLLRSAETQEPREEVAAQRHRHRTINLPDDGSFHDVATASFGYTREMSIDDLVGSLGTYSGLITATEAERRAGLGRARAAIEGRFPGAETIGVPIRSWCWRAERI
jgi:SAM-dependent methyltransferase